MRTGRSTRRRTIALWTCFLWLLAVEVLPALHEGLHRDDHTHAANGTIVRVAFGAGSVHEHEHDALGRDVEPAAARDAHGHRHGGPTSDGHARLGRSQPPRHDAAGAGHHAVALLDPPRPPVVSRSIDIVAYQIEHRVLDRVDAGDVVPPAARGPPVPARVS